MPRGQPAFVVVPIGEEHIDGFRAAVESVARERNYLALLEAPPEADTRNYVRQNIAERVPHFVALADGKVVGWCDVAVRPRPTQRHSGILGMGVIRDYRGQGIGRSLMQATLAAAKARGLRRIELTVRVDNEPARRLYESFGFATEGLCKRHMHVDGEFVDSWLMALLP
jgi:ribosomal protein S18 acetylase RimI-like enzyme